MQGIASRISLSHGIMKLLPCTIQRSFCVVPMSRLALKLLCMPSMSQRGSTKIQIFARDSNVLVLSMRHYRKLPQYSIFVPAAAEKLLYILKRCVLSLGPLKAAALPHYLSGSDIVGRLAGKTKLSYRKTFNSASEDSFLALKVYGM